MPEGSNYYVIPRVIYKTSNPTITSDTRIGIEVLQLWINTITGEKFICTDNALDAAKWTQLLDYFDPTANMVPSAQTEINAAVANNNVLITPEISYYSSGLIDYNITIPTNANAMSVGPITIDAGNTVTVDGTWTVI